MAADEYRLEIDLHDAVHGEPLSERLRSFDLDDEVAARLGERVIVTRDGERIFVYTQSPEAAAEAERVVGAVLEREDFGEAEVRSRRWNPAERFWQDADEPLSTDAETSEPPDYAAKAARDGVPSPLFMFIENHQPEFMRDLGV